MNNTRRKKIQDVINELKSIQDEEQDYMDNMPESLQGGDRYNTADEAVSYLEDAISSLENIE